MIEHGDVVDWLRSENGTDVNFERPTWEALQGFLNTLIDSFREYTALNEDGEEVSLTNPQTIVFLKPGPHYVHVVFEGGTGVMKRLQLYMGAEEDGALFVELTFWPENLGETQALRTWFLEWGSRLCTALGARRWFARESSVGWEMGDTRVRSGLFFASASQRGTDA
jgi:hypothetical protein